MKKRALHIVLVSLFILTSSILPKAMYAQLATFEDCRIEQNAEEKGKKMLKCHYTARKIKAQGHKTVVVMTVETSKGEPHHTKNGGIVKAEKVIKNDNKYNSILLEDRWIGIYHSNLNLLSGKHTYYVRLLIYDLVTGDLLGRSDYMTFTMTGGSDSNSSAQNSSSQNTKKKQNPSNNTKNSGSNTVAPKSNNSSKKWAKINAGPGEFTSGVSAVSWVAPKNGKMANGTNIGIYGYSSGFSFNNLPEWYFKAAGDGSYYICWAKNHDYVIDVKDGVVDNGTNIQLYKCNNSKAQKWFFESCHTDPSNPKEDHEAYIIRSALNTNYVMEMDNEYGEDNTNIRLKRYNGKITQMWRIFIN